MEEQFKLEMSASAWGLYSATDSRTNIIACNLNRSFTAMARKAKLEILSNKEIHRIVYQWYDKWSDKYCEYGFGDTEGRYGAENATEQYLKAHDAYDAYGSLQGDWL